MFRSCYLNQWFSSSSNFGCYSNSIDLLDLYPPWSYHVFEDPSSEVVLHHLIVGCCCSASSLVAWLTSIFSTRLILHWIVTKSLDFNELPPDLWTLTAHLWRWQSLSQPKAGWLLGRYWLILNLVDKVISFEIGINSTFTIHWFASALPNGHFSMKTRL